MLTLFVYDEILGFAARVENSSSEVSHGTAKETLGRLTKKANKTRVSRGKICQPAASKFVMYI